MTARGFCTCKHDFPGRLTFHPPAGAAWHYLCDKPVLPPMPEPVIHDCDPAVGTCYCGEARARADRADRHRLAGEVMSGFTAAELASLDDGSGDIYRAVHNHTIDEHGDLIHACRACLAEAFPGDPPEYAPAVAELTAADLPDVACAGCGHPRGADCGCSCTGPGTCGGGTDDIE